MIEHHGALNNGIAQLAQRRNIALPTDLSAEQKADADRLAALPVGEFDRAYMQLNADTHEQVVAAFRQQADQGTDADVRLLADLSLPILKIHLAAAKDINSAINPAAFLATAYQDGLAEVELSQLALQKASSDEVRDFAQRMLNDHTLSNSQIASLAQQKNVTLPGAIPPDHQAAADELSALGGADFDKAYMDMNVIDHAKAVRLFRKQARQGLDNDVSDLARSSVPILEGHLVMAVEIDREIEPSFLFSAYQDGKAEVRLSQLALLKASNNDARLFAQRMFDEHNTVNAQIAQLAQQKNIPLTTEMSPEQTLAFVALLGLTGQEFDQAFMRYSERLHSNAVDEFTAQAAQGTDADLRTFARITLPVLNAHLTLARQNVDQLVAESE